MDPMSTVDTLRAHLKRAEKTLAYVRTTGRDSTSYVLDVLDARRRLEEAVKKAA